jgi:hypothetical protein
LSAPAMLQIVNPGTSELTKKRATFGPLSHARLERGAVRAPNPSQPLEITLFFTGCDPASAQVCHDRPRTPAGPKGVVNACIFEPFQSNPAH